MKITENCKKEFWVRKVAPDVKLNPPRAHKANYVYPNGSPQVGEQYLTQEDFDAEIWQSAHSQMSREQSMRAVWKQVKNKDNPNKAKWKIDHFDDIEVTTCGVQKRGADNFVSHMAGKGFGMANETKSFKDIYNQLCSWKDIVGISTTAFVEICVSLAYTCDAAIYIYATNNNTDIEYKVFSHLYGDELYEWLDENRNKVGARKYSLNGKNAIDLFYHDRIQTWVVYNKEDKEADSSWWSKVRNWFNNKSGLSHVGEVSEDGYICVYDVETQTLSRNQWVYFRVSDLRSGCCQFQIEGYEKAESYVAEEYKNGAFPDMFIKAEKIVSLPPRGIHGRVFGVKGSAENVKAADAKYIAPENMSNVATTNLNLKWEDIKNSMQLVFINPEILKSGADSSTTIKILFTPELQYCQIMWVKIYKQLKEMMAVFKELVGKVEGKGSEYAKLRISIYPDFWIPNNTAEEIDNACKLVYAGILSQENSRSYLDLQYLNDARQVAKEKEDQLYRETEIPLKAKYEAEKKYGISDVSDNIDVHKSSNDNPDDDKYPIDTGAPKIDNNMDRKNIAE